MKEKCEVPHILTIIHLSVDLILPLVLDVSMLGDIVPYTYTYICIYMYTHMYVYIYVCFTQHYVMSMPFPLD